MDSIVSALVELLFEIVLEVLGRGAARTGRAAVREASGIGEPNTGWRVVSVLLPIGTGIGLGAWRGAASDGDITWGWWLSIAIVVGCLIGLTRSEADATKPPSDIWKRTFTWWPRRRLGWFLAGNLAFALAYLATR